MIDYRDCLVVMYEVDPLADPFKPCEECKETVASVEVRWAAPGHEHGTDFLCLKCAEWVAETYQKPLIKKGDPDAKAKVLEEMLK